MAIKHELNYSIIKEALSDYLNNNGSVNKKQIKEEEYKLEDLQNSKAFMVDKSSREGLLIEPIFSTTAIYDMIHGFFRNNKSKTLYKSQIIKIGNKSTKERCAVRCIYEEDIPDNERLNKAITLICDIMSHSFIRNNIDELNRAKLFTSINKLKLQND